MSERDEESFKSVQLEQHEADTPNPAPEVFQSSPSAPSSAVAQSTETAEKASPPASSSSHTTTANADAANAPPGQKWTSALNQFKLKRFFVLRVMKGSCLLDQISNCAVFAGNR